MFNLTFKLDVCKRLVPSGLIGPHINFLYPAFTLCWGHIEHASN